MMAQLRNVTILMIVFVAAVSTEAKDYTVGGTTGWTSFPPGGASFYSKWASNFTFKVNDTLVFNFESGSHAVAEVTKANHDKCEVKNNIKVLNTGPAKITLDHTGEFYFTCTFSGHCSSGQKLSIKVSGTSFPVPAPAPAPTPKPKRTPAEAPSASAPASGSVPSSPSNEGSPSSPTQPGAIAPPPQGSATPLSATFSLLLVTIAINFLSQF
ncbi:cucumber peeling cupredoxin-like [Abrus precatorius]|uniref:Cucumber peeling cupredoxin-like n=1 Tax=Abrus precatorius TaxID=3816 RepID=A0A8B8JSS9_ABRPR|nr:cucumber peeling cupredoxin-like [Abrus precatorius]